MDIARDVLQDRIDEIQDYINLIESLDAANKNGKSSVTPGQYHILIANTFVLMYNMIEATITQSIKRLEEIISQNKDCPHGLSDKIFSEWIATFLGTKEQLSHEKRLTRGKKFYQHVISNSKTELSLNRSGGGNWDDEEIHRFSERIGIDPRSIPLPVLQNVKKVREDDLGCMKFIVRNRNKLAHGEISFSECGKDKDIGRIKEIFCDTSQYLSAVVDLFEDFLEQRHFIASPESWQHADELIKQ